MAKVETNDIMVESGATAYGTKDNDIFHITAETGDATIDLANQGVDTLYFDVPIWNNCTATHIAGTKDLAITYSLDGDPDNNKTITVKNYFTSTKATDSKSSLKNIHFQYVDDDVVYSGTFIEYVWYEGLYTEKGNTITASKFSDDIYLTTAESGKIVKLGDGNDYLSASDYSDTIYGGNGNDTMWGNDGDDIINGGKGTNNYNFDKYDGKDTIILTKGESANVKLYSFEEMPIESNKLSYKLDDKGNAVIYLDESDSDAGSITLKDFANKNITKAANLIIDNGEPINLKTDVQWEKTITKNYNGSYLNEKIDASGLTEPTKVKKGIEYGVTINAGAGNDTITGSMYNDTFIGGAGTNTLNIKNGWFGDDVVKLTKGETLNIEKDDGVSFSYSQGRNKKDLLITTNTGSTLTLKNYYAKNTGATVYIDGHDLSKDAIMDPVNAGNYFEEPSHKMRTKYTGSILADNVDASGLTQATKVKKGVEYGVTINGGGGDDVIVGSDFVDTIKGGLGDDTITGGKGNDKLYGEKGLNTFIFNAGDGNDFVYGGKGEDTLNFENMNLADLEFERGVNKKGKPTNDLIIYYNHDEDGVAQDSVTVKDFYKTKKGKSTTSIRHIVAKDGSFDISQMLEPPVIQTLDSTHPVYNNVASNRPHVITSTDTGSYEITLGDSSSNIVDVTGGSAYNVTLGDGNKNTVTVGEEDNMLEGAYAAVTVGDGDENKIHLYKTGSYTGAHVGNGNGNEIIVGGTDNMVGTYTNIDVGSGNNNKIITNNSQNSIITIKNGDNNEVYSYGTGYTNINASVGYSYSEEGDTHLGSTYMEVGYNQGETRSSADIQSFGNDTIKGLGQVNVTLQNPTTSTKTFLTNFADREVNEKSQTNISIPGATANINIKLQDDIEDNGYTTYFSLYNNNFVYGALDESGSDLDGEIYVSTAYVNMTGVWQFRFNPNGLFINPDGTCHSLGDETQLYDMARAGSNDFIQNRDIVYNDYSALIVNGTADDDSIIAYGATINAKGGTNSIISGGNDIINVTGVDNIYFSTDDIDEETGEMINTYKTINIASGAQASLDNILNVGSTTLNYNIDNIYDFVFENAGEYEELDGGDRNYYITLYARDSEGNILNSGDRIYGKWDIYYNFDFDQLDEDGNLLLDNKLTVMAGDNSYGFKNMTQYVDLNNESYEHSFDVGALPAYTTYVGRGYYVQGSEENDSYYYEWTDVTIKEAGGNDTLELDRTSNFSHFRLFYDVDAEGNVGDDLIIASTFGENNNFAKMFYLDDDLTDGDDTMTVRNAANVLTIKDYFKTSGGSIENIIAEDSHTDMKLNYGRLLANGDIKGSDNYYYDSIVEKVVSWLDNHTDYTSAMDALQNCKDADALNELMACYTGDNAATFGDLYWSEYTGS